MSRLQLWKRRRLADHGIDYLYYLSHLDNLASILEKGILPRSRLAAGKFTDISNHSAQRHRHSKSVATGPDKLLSGHELVPLFFTPNNPMLFVLRDQAGNLAVLAIRASELCRVGLTHAFTDGNLAANDTTSYYSFNRLDEIPWDVINAERWDGLEDGRRRRAAEFLVEPLVPADAIDTICVASDVAARRVRDIVNESKRALAIEVKPQVFFQ